MQEPIYKGILIDPFCETVTEITLETPFLASLGKALGSDCEWVDGVTLENISPLHDVVIDDSGKFSGDQKYFRVAEHIPYRVLAGRGVVMSVDANGDWANHKLSVEEFKKKVVFMTRAEALEAIRAIAREFMI